MGRVANRAVDAKKRAKERRIKLYEDRAARDARVEAAAAAFFVAQDGREAALAALEEADGELAAQVRALTDREGLTQGQVAELLDIDGAEVRRLLKLGPAAQAADQSAPDAPQSADEPERNAPPMVAAEQ